jgi:hypothetical protein
VADWQIKTAHADVVLNMGTGRNDDWCLGYWSLRIAGRISIKFETYVMTLYEARSNSMGAAWITCQTQLRKTTHSNCSNELQSNWNISTALLETLTVPQLVKKFSAFYGTRRFITAFTSAHHLSLS